MMSVNEARSAEDVTRSANDANQRPTVHLIPRAVNHQVRSSPDATERHRIVALGLDTAIPIAVRPNFVSSENISRVQHLLLSDAHYIQHGTIRQLPELIQLQNQRGQQQQQQQPASSRRAGSTSRPESAPTMTGTGSSDQSRMGSLRRPPPGFRDALRDSQDIAAAMATLDKQTRPQDDEEEFTDAPSYDSSVDDPNTYPALPSITRRQSEQLDRGTGKSLPGKWSLPDLRKFETAFTQILSMEGITEPDAILRLLDAHPEIGCLYMSPIVHPTDANYSPYVMHLVYPGRVDILNCCVVTRKHVTRYIKGKEPRRLTLKRWSFEQRVMIRLRKIHFFKNFKLLKAFSALGHHLDMSAFGKTKRKLRSKLMTCNPNYAETLLLVRTMCLDMAALSLIHVDAELTYTLGEFMEDQEQYSRDVTTKLERYLTILLHLVSRMCWDDVIAAGLAEESKGRRGGAPKRVNEIRKMQRLRQSTAGIGSRQTADDVNIGIWTKSSDKAESLELERRKKERCNILSRFIYLVDCLIRASMYEVFTASLKTTANYLSLHLETFPSDDEISAIVRGYVGDLDQFDMFSLNGNDDDGDSGGGPGVQRGPKVDANTTGHLESHNVDKTLGNDKPDGQAGSNAAQGRQEEVTSANKSRPNTETEASTTWTTLRMSSSGERLGTDTAGFGTPSTMDNAVYSPAQGETDLTDSIDTTSSTLSDDQENINPLGTSELGNLSDPGGDDFYAPVLVGMGARITRLHGGQNENLFMSNAGHLGASVDQEVDVDDVTVIERRDDIHQIPLDETSLPLSSVTNGRHESFLVHSDADETEDDLTITSDDKSSFSSRRKDTQSNNFAFHSPSISSSIYHDKIGNRESKNQLQIGKIMLQTSHRPFFSAASGMLASVSASSSISKKDISRKRLDEALNILQETREIFDSDSSDSIYDLPHANVLSDKERESHQHPLYPSLAHAVKNIAKKRSGKEDEASYPINNSTHLSDTVVADDSPRIEETNSALSATFSRRREMLGGDIQAFTFVSATDTHCCESRHASISEPDPRSNAAKWAHSQVFSSTTDRSGIFSALFNQTMESSVDSISETEEAQRTAVSFPVLERTTWMSDYLGNYVNVRSSRSSSVDEYGFLGAGILPTQACSKNVLAENRNSREIVVRTPDVELSPRREGNASDDDTTVSFDSVRSFEENSASENRDAQSKGGEKDFCQHKSTEEVNPGAKKSIRDENAEAIDNQTENGSILERDGNRVLAITEYQSNNVENWMPEFVINYQTVETSDTVSDEEGYYYNEENETVYVNANTSPNTEDKDKFGPAEFFVNEENDNYFDIGNVLDKVTDFPAKDKGSSDTAFTKDSTSGVRKDGGKRRKMGKSNQDGETSQEAATTSNTNDLSTQNDEQPEQEQQKSSEETVRSRATSLSAGKKNTMKSNAAISQSSPCVLSEESSYAKDLQQLEKVLPEALAVLFKVQVSKLPKYEMDHTRSSHGHDVHYTSMNSSFAKTESECSLTLTNDDVESVHEAHLNTLVEEDNMGEEARLAQEWKIHENDTENDLTDGVLEFSLDENIESVESAKTSGRDVKAKNSAENEQTAAADIGGGPQGSWDENQKYVQEMDNDDIEENPGGQNGGGGRKAAAGGGGGGGGGGSGGPSTKKRWVPDLKPMFHASLSIDRELVCMTPDVYDFTAASFNVVHDMEMRLRSVENLTSNPAFLTFTQPSADGQTSVDKKPKGPNLDRVIRFDPNVTNLKNTIYGSIDYMFHSVAVYTKEMQTLYLKYFQERHLDFDMDPKDVGYYINHLQRYDVQLKIVDRLPESQRLGMFLIDLTPYNEFVRQCSVGSLQQMQLDLNADVVRRTRRLIEKLNDLHTVLESHPTTLVPLFQRLTTMDSVSEVLQNIENVEVSHIGALYSVIDRFDVPHTEVDRRAFESTHYLITSARHTGEARRHERYDVIDAIEKCLTRDVRYIHTQVKCVVKPLVESETLLEGRSNPLEIIKSLIHIEEVVKTHVAMANFLREVQRYLGRPETRFTELFHLSSRYVNTRNLWLLMADWDTKLQKWKNQSFQTLDMQEINNYTFKYMEACDKLEKLLPKNTVVSVFEEKMDVMLRWLNFIIEFRGQAVKPRHWSQIEEVLGVEFGEELPLTLTSLMSINAIDKQKSLHVILNKARAESNVQNEYDEVAHQCRNLTLPVQSRQKSLVEGEELMTVYSLGDTFEIEESLNYFVMELERIELSPHSGFLHNTLEEFVQHIFEALEKLVQWMEMQMKLSRLRRLIVRHPEVSETLPAEVARYKEIYLAYSQFMQTVQADPSVMGWCRSQELQDILEGQHDEIIRLYRTFKRDIEMRGEHENPQQDAQQQFGTWVVM